MYHGRDCIRLPFATLPHPSQAVFPETNRSVADIVPAFPEHLHVHCIDDSAMARGLLSHYFRRELPGSFIHMYGETKEDCQVPRYPHDPSYPYPCYFTCFRDANCV